MPGRIGHAKLVHRGGTFEVGESCGLVSEAPGLPLGGNLPSGPIPAGANETSRGENFTQGGHP